MCRRGRPLRRIAGRGGGSGARPSPTAPAAAIAIAVALAAAGAPAFDHAVGGATAAHADPPEAAAFAAATHAANPAGTVRAAGAPESPFVPGAVAANSTHMFVADSGGGRVLVFEIAAGDAEQEQREQPPLPDAVREVRGSPYGIAVNGTGHLFVSDPASGRVAVIGPGGDPAGELPAAGSSGSTGAVPMDGPAGIAVAPDGRVYVAERNAGRVLVFGADGGVGGEPGSISHAGPAGRLLAPSDVAVDPRSGTVYVADAAADAVHVFGPDGSHERTVKVPPLNGTRGSPHGVAVDPRSGTVYVASLLQGAIHAYDSSGAPAGPPALLAPLREGAPEAARPRPLSVAVRGDGILLVSDASGGGAVLVHPNGTAHSAVAGRAANWTAGPFAPVDADVGGGSSGSGSGRFTMYVVDAGAGAVSAYAPGPPSGPPALLWSSPLEAGGPPAGVAVDDSSGRVLVSAAGDAGGIAVRVISAGDGSPAGALHEWVGAGRPAGIAAGPGGIAAVAGPAAGAVRLLAANGSLLGEIGGLSDPVDAAFMSDGSLVVAERGAHAVRVFGPGAGQEWAASAAAASAVAATVASFGLWSGGVFMPEAVAVDGGDRIIVADAGGTVGSGPRVQVFDYAGRLVSQFDRGAGWEAAPRTASHGAPAGLGASPGGGGGAVLLAVPDAGGGGAAVRSFAALDSEAPAVSSFGIVGGGPGAGSGPGGRGGPSLGPYSQIAANVTFTEPVVVRQPQPTATAGPSEPAEEKAGLGPPALALGIEGGAGRAALLSDEFCGPGNGTAPYSSGSGTSSLIFSYTVLPGESAAALGYASADPVDPRGSSITDLAGNRASLSMPPPAAGGSVAVNGSAGAFLGVGLLAASASAPDSRAAGLAACDFNRELASARGPGSAAAAASGPFISLTAAEAPGALDVEASGGWADRRAALALAALRDAHAGGSGPAAYVTTLPDEALATPSGPLQNSTAVGYAAGRGVLLVATAASSAPSLPAGAGGGGMLYRVSPGGGHLAHAVSAAIGSEIDVLFPIIQADAFGEPAPARPGAAPFSHGLYGIILGHLRDAGGIVNGFDVGALNYDRTRRAEFNFTAPHGGWGADAAALDLNLALLKGQVGDSRVAVLYLGSAAEYVKLAEAVSAAAGGAPSLSGTRWLAAGGVAASPLVEESAAASSLAASTGLEAIAFGVGGGGAGGSAVPGYEPPAAALRVDSLVGPAQGVAARAYSAYDAVQILGRAAALAADRAAGGEEQEAKAPGRAPSAGDVSAAMADAAQPYRGALGTVRLDAASGGLDLPITHDVWRMDGEAGRWYRSSVERGIDSCSISLAAPDLDFGPVKARAASAPLRQTISNTGTLDLVGVALFPGEWDTGAGGEAEGEAAEAALPASLTEYVDELSAPFARFAAVSGGPPGTTVVAGGLEPAAEAGVLFRLNLRSVQSLDGMGEMSQSMVYTASCDW